MKKQIKKFIILTGLCLTIATTHITFFGSMIQTTSLGYYYENN